MALPDALADLSNAELRALADGIERGAVSDDRVAAIADALAADPDAVGAATEDKPAVEALVEVVEDATDRVVVPRIEPTGGPVLTEAARQAVNRVESLLEPTGMRSAGFFFDLREALQTGDADFSAQLTQDVLDAIPPDERERLAEVADDRGQRAAAETMTLDDFPAVQQATERAPGRTVAGYWQPLLADLEAGDPDDSDTLRAADVPDDQIRALMSNDRVRQRFIDRVQRHIRDIKAERGEGPAAPGGAGVEIEDLSDLGEAAREATPTGPPSLTDFQRRFVDLAHDVGWCDVFPCRRPLRYFEADMTTRKRRYQFSTPQGFINFWVLQGLVSKDDLRERGFDPDVVGGIPG